MDRSTWNADELFFAALEIDDREARESFLVASCGRDSELRGRVERLLAANSRVGHFLDPPAAVATAAYPNAPFVEGPGTVIGPYKLLEAIGEGGMGVVYMAEQAEPVRRMVALKVIKPGMDSRQILARFDAERQALAMMDHPNIARVLDADATDSGRPYFVMELVRGIPITEYCDREQLPVPERLELFVLVCRAVQHAHQKGVIHRDLKPSNILVTVGDGAPLPKVIDFGIAKATGSRLTDKTLFTGFTQLVGTPLYMSPEQAELAGVDVDTRSDIYSLGVLLYELLTGTTPFDGEVLRKAAFDEMRRIIREEEPPKPSTRLSTLGGTLTTTSAKRKADPRRLEKSMRGELDWIVMKAMEKDRRRRYETANDFAADVMRHLTDRPVEACPPSALYRLGKFTRRNRVALTTSALIAAALIAGTAVSVWQAIRAVKAGRETVVALAEARLQGREARKAVDEMYTQVAEKWIAGQPSLTRLQSEFLEKALTFYERFAAGQGPDPQLRHDAIRALYRAGAIRLALGRRDEAETAFRQVVALGADLVRAYPNRREFRLALAEGRIKLVRLYMEAGRFQPGDRGVDVDGVPVAAKAHASRPIDADRELRQAGRELEDLRKELTDDAADRRRLAEASESLSAELTQANRHPEAKEAVRAAFKIWESLARDFPADVEYRYGLARSYGWQGLQLLWWGGQHIGEAEAAYREAEFRLAKLREEQPGDPRFRNSLTKVMQNLLVILNKPDRLAEAERLGHRALSLIESLAVDFPEIPEHQEQLAGILGNLANVIDKHGQGRTLEAEGLRRRAVALLERLADRHPDVPEYEYKAGLALAAQSMTLNRLGKVEEARRVHEGRVLRARHYLKAHPEQKSAQYIERDVLISGVFFAIVGADRSAAVRMAEEWAHKTLSPYTPDKLGATVVRLSESQARVDPEDTPASMETHAVLNKALIRESIHRGLDDPHSLSRLSLLISSAPEAQRDPELALRFARRATEQTPDDGWSLRSLGWALYRVGDWKGCIAALEKQKSYPQEGDFFAAMAHGRLGDTARASSVYKLADGWLQGYEKRCEERKKAGLITYPDPAMLRRIQSEAAALLGMNPRRGESDSKPANDSPSPGK